MSATMRPTLQTVPESLPADHVTNASGTTTTTTTAPTETKTHSHTNTSLLKNKSSSTTRVSLLLFVSFCVLLGELIVQTLHVYGVSNL